MSPNAEMYVPSAYAMAQEDMRALLQTSAAEAETVAMLMQQAALDDRANKEAPQDG